MHPVWDPTGWDLMAKYQFMCPGTTGFSSASSYVTMSAALQLVASACGKKCVKLYLKESVHPPCTIHSLNSVNERVSVRLFDGEFHWGEVFDEAVTSLPTKFDRHFVTLPERENFAETTCGGTERSLQPVSSRGVDGSMGAQLSTGVSMGLYYLKLVLQRDGRKSDLVSSKALA